MGNKNQKNCCCGGCSKVPWDTSLLLGPNELQPMQQYCCACVPRQLCVSFVPDDVSNDYETNLFPLLECGYDNDPRSQYVGELGIEGEERELRFTFEVDDDRVCYLALTSEYLGADGGSYYRIVMDEETRAVFCPRCGNCNEELDEPEALEFRVSDPYPASVFVRPVGNTDLPRRERCCDCPDPCDNPYAMEDTEEVFSRCPGECAGCNCICSCACITVLHQGAATTYNVCLCNYTYYLPVHGMSISIVNDGSGCCALQLEPGDLEPQRLGEIELVPIGALTNNCPHPEANWLYELAYDDPYNPPEESQMVQVFFHCYACGDCVRATTECCPEPISRILTASFSGGGYCCGDFEMKLFYDQGTQTWTGSSETAFCGLPIEISITCTPFGQWELTVNAGGCLATTETPIGQDYYTPGSYPVEPTWNCDPFSVSFELTLEGGDDCCDGNGGGTVGVVITE